MNRIALIVTLSVALAACANTARGVQKDLQNTGKTIIRATDR